MVRHRYEVVDGGIFITLSSSRHIKGRQTPETADRQSLLPREIGKISQQEALPFRSLISVQQF